MKETIIEINDSRSLDHKGKKEIIVELEMEWKNGRQPESNKPRDDDFSEDLSNNQTQTEITTEDNLKWHNIDWKKSINRIEEMQAEIVRESKKSNWKGVMDLQRKLVTGFDGRALAVRKVITNKGGRTAGVDNVNWTCPKDYYRAIGELKVIVNKPKEYKASPLKRVLIPKPGKKEMRGLGIPTMIDRAVQAVYHLAVDPVVEENSDLNSYGFRKRKSTHDAMSYLRNYLDKPHSSRWILEADIAKCFDRISHEFLMKHTKICDKEILKQWLKSGVFEAGHINPTEEGTPQGGIISPTLCNIALNGLEEVVKGSVKRKKGLTPGVKVVRYADDIVITGKNPEMLREIKDVVKRFLEERGLTLSEEKTRITHIKEGINFLGFSLIRQPWDSRRNEITDQENVLVVKPTEKGIKNLMTKIKMVTKTDNMEDIVNKLNPILRGWAEHKRVVPHAREAFAKIDHYVWQRLRSRIVMRTKGGVKAAFQTIRLGKGVWGTNYGQRIVKLGLVGLVRYKLVKLGLNPYSPDNREYYDKLRTYRIMSKLKTTVFKKYNFKCEVCGDSLFNGERVDIHHIKPVKEGGNNTLKNLMPLHKICHMKVTHGK